MGILLLRQGKRVGKRNGEDKGKIHGTYPFMEDTKQCADGDALINQAGLL